MIRHFGIVILLVIQRDLREDIREDCETCRSCQGPDPIYLVLKLVEVSSIGDNIRWQSPQTSCEERQRETSTKVIRKAPADRVQDNSFEN